MSLIIGDLVRPFQKNNHSKEVHAQYFREIVTYSEIVRSRPGCVKEL